MKHVATTFFDPKQIRHTFDGGVTFTKLQTALPAGASALDGCPSIRGL
jgi:hypothetical protein